MSGLLDAAVARLREQEKAEIAAWDAKSPPHPETKKFFDAVKGNDVNAVKELLQMGVPANIRSHDIQRWTPLHFASTSEMINILLAAGANINAINNMNFFTPMHAAATAGCFDTVLALLAATPTPDVQALDKYNQSILFHACSGAKSEARNEAILALLAHGADPNTGSDTGLTPLMQASRKKNAPAVKALLAASACTLLRNDSGESALDLVQGEDGDEVRQLIVAYGKENADKEQAFMKARAKATAPAEVESAADPSIQPQRSVFASAQNPNDNNLWGVGDIVQVKVAGSWNESSGKVLQVKFA